MPSTMAVVVGVVVVLAVVALVLLLTVGLRDYRSRRLRVRFGPEYERAVEETGDRREAERLLHERTERRQELPIRDLDQEARERYTAEWRGVQSRFVDDPVDAVGAADDLVTRVMRDRGYPTGSFEQQVADVSVDHAGAAASYRRARAVLTSARDQVATDDLRQAMVHYRELFVELVGAQVNGAAAQQARDDREAEMPRSGRREVT